jgi:hypothetical protein
MWQNPRKAGETRHHIRNTIAPVYDDLVEIAMSDNPYKKIKSSTGK